MSQVFFHGFLCGATPHPPKKQYVISCLDSGAALRAEPLPEVSLYLVIVALWVPVIVFSYELTFLSEFTKCLVIVNSILNSK